MLFLSGLECLGQWLRYYSYQSSRLLELTFDAGIALICYSLKLTLGLIHLHCCLLALDLNSYHCKS
jgi:hypothetical protein